MLRATTTSAKWLHTRRSTEPAFQPSRATKHRKKHGVSQLFYLLAHRDLLSTDSFSSLPLPTSAASSVHIVGSLTSNPSIKYMYMHTYIYIYNYKYIIYICVCVKNMHTHIHTHTHIYIYICMYGYIYIYKEIIHMPYAQPRGPAHSLPGAPESTDLALALVPMMSANLLRSTYQDGSGA